MKQGWIQVTNGNNTQEDLAPKTLASAVYTDETMTETVQEALEKSCIGVYSHTQTENADGSHTNHFIGPEGHIGLSVVWLSAAITNGDQLTVNGQAVDAFDGPSNVFSLPQYCWVMFMFDGSTVRFVYTGS